ncbi:MAG: 3-beta hydroxysteroid dehydrogenase/isomerase [Parcubacteria group bacterium Gr01-1014_8]|nr:MAG: 3-beta hydroxysteroid dehydrogenase/isomerase [Parcubacteria group bacterium Gr01-1014_8]
MKILVTGAAGFIGSHLAERLVKDGHIVIALDCFTDYYDVRIKEINAGEVQSAGAKFLKLDLAEDDLVGAVSGVEAIFHCAAQPGISSSTPFESYVRNNIVATERLLLAAEKEPSLKVFINFATSSVYGVHANGNETMEPRPASYYGVTKLAAEQLVLARARSRGFPGISLRIFSVYGERERPEKLYHKLTKAILEDTPFPLFDGSREHVRSFTYVGDIVEACTQVLAAYEACIGEIFNVGNDTTHTTDEGINLIEGLVGKKATFEMQPARPGDQHDTAANIAKAHAAFGFAPKTDLREGLKREVDWYRAKIYGKLRP